MLTASIAMITVVRPKRSERWPAVEDARKPVRWKSAPSRAPPPVARARSCPCSTSDADRNAGVQAHIPRSSHEWHVYPTDRRRAAGFRRNSDTKPWPAWRGWMRVGVPHTVQSATAAPRTGPSEHASSVARQPKRLSTAPVRKSDAA